MNRIYTFSLIKTFYDRGRDYLDSFWPLVLRVLPRDKSAANLDVVSTALEREFAFTPPRQALETIVTRGSRKGLVTRREHSIALTDRGLSEISKLEDDRDVQRRIGELVEAAQNFLRDRGQNVESSDLLTLLQNFIATHLEFFEKFMRGQESEGPRISKDIEAALLDFLKNIEQSNPQLFRTLHEVFLGSIISTAVYTASFGDVSEKFGKTKVFLDSNLVFSIFGFHFDEVNRPAQELFAIMKDLNVFNFYVFDFTVEEMSAVLRPYARRQHRFLPDIRVDSIFSSLKAKGWTKSDMRQFIGSIEERLGREGILVQPTDIDLKTYSIDPSTRTALRKYKPNQQDLSQTHDLAAIALVKKMRGGVVRRLERSRFFFLTADSRLTQYDLEVEGHEDGGTVTEVVPDRVLSTFLWLKDPARTGDVLLHAVIAMHSRDLLIDRLVWDRFFETVVDLRTEGRVSDADVGVLLYDEQVHSYLRKAKPQHVTAERVIKQAEDAQLRLKRFRDEQETAIVEETQRRIEELETQFLSDAEELKDQALIAEEQREEGILEAIASAKSGIEAECKTQSRLAIRISLFVIGLVGSYLILKTGREDQLFLAQLGIVGMWVLLIVGMIKDPRDLRSSAETSVFNWLYTRRLARSRIEQIETSVGPEPVRRIK